MIIQRGPVLSGGFVHIMFFFSAGICRLQRGPKKGVCRKKKSTWSVQSQVGTSFTLTPSAKVIFLLRMIVSYRWLHCMFLPITPCHSHLKCVHVFVYMSNSTCVAALHSLLCISRWLQQFTDLKNTYNSIKVTNVVLKCDVEDLRPSSNSFSEQ